jgi:hypothetical protein
MVLSHRVSEVGSGGSSRWGWRRACSGRASLLCLCLCRGHARRGSCIGGQLPGVRRDHLGSSDSLGYRSGGRLMSPSSCTLLQRTAEKAQECVVELQSARSRTCIVSTVADSIAPSRQVVASECDLCQMIQQKAADTAGVGGEDGLDRPCSSWSKPHGAAEMEVRSPALACSTCSPMQEEGSRGAQRHERAARS